VAPRAEEFDGYPAKNKNLGSDCGPNCQKLWRGDDRLSGSWLPAAADGLNRTCITGGGECAMDSLTSRRVKGDEALKWV
jgi:hypothetical protein